MKTILFTFTFALTTFFATAQSETEIVSEGTSITVNIPVKGTGGNIVVGLYDQNTFMKAAPLQGLESDIVDGKATVTFENVAPGIYAISLFHDKNGNKQMDFEPNGMPKEMYGVSNNVMNMGPPQWNDAKFEVGNEALSLDIVM